MVVVDQCRLNSIEKVCFQGQEHVNVPRRIMILTRDQVAFILVLTLFRMTLLVSLSPTIMTATPKSNTSAQRVNRAYIDLSASKSSLVLSNNRISGASPHVASSSKVKENTPVQRPNMLMNQQSSPSISRKRKLSSTLFPEVVITSVPKKSKLSAKTNHSERESAVHSSGKADNATPEFPHGFVYCHQCNKKRDVLRLCFFFRIMIAVLTNSCTE